MRLRRSSRAALCLWALCAPLGASLARADASLHSLWELHGKHNTVYVLGSIHTLRPSDYPLSNAIMDAYRDSKALYMEIDLDEMSSPGVQSEMVQAAMLPDGTTLEQAIGPARYARAQSLAHEVGVDLSLFAQFAPWFAAEAISQLQLAQLGFDAQSGVEMYFMERARSDGKKVEGLETAHEQMALFEGMPMETQAEYLMSSLEQARDLPKQVDDMVHAWQRGDTGWFQVEIKSDIGRDPRLYQSFLVARNRKWIGRIEALLDDDQNYLIIVGTAHLVGRDSVIELLKRDGIGAVQR
ncbi:MAG TPA: TraB/GumN family protein [Steroidobacteraceae bacterium]|nr:TraB/GumN family protein [Steroidobacteraceae bacterium]